MIAPSKPPRITLASTNEMSIIPLPIVLATAVPTVKSAAKLNVAAQSTAVIGFRTRVPRSVAREFAESGKPLMKSKTNAMMTIAMTYPITRRAASRVLQGDALHHLRDAHAAIGRALERVVHLLPLQHLERIGVAGEEVTHCGMVDRVRLLLQLLDVRCFDADGLRLTNRFDARLDVLRGLDEPLRKLPGRFLHDVDVEHLEPTGGPVEQIDDVVETRGEHVDVLAIDRRDEALVDALIDGAREDVCLVLDVLDRPHMIGDVLRIIEQLRQHPRRLSQVRGELVEEVKELLVVRNQLSEQTHSGLPCKGGRKIPAPNRTSKSALARAPATPGVRGAPTRARRRAPASRRA